MVRRSGVDDVLAPWEFERLFETAASIKDLELAIEMAYLLYIPSRFGPRNGETLHISEAWYIRNASEKIVGLRIPTAAPDCECKVCQRRAKDRAKADEDPNASVEDYIDDYWSPKSHAGGRTIPVLQERGRELLELYAIKHTEKPNMIGQTYRNRLKRLEELCHGVALHITPQAGRATCANYWALWGVDAKYLRHLMGWKYISTAQYYIEKSDVHLRSAMQRALGREATVPYEMHTDPPTFLDLRPDDPEDLIEVGHVTPESQLSSSSTQSSPSPDADDDPLEKHVQARREHVTFDQLDDPEVLTATPTGAAVALVGQGGRGLRRRARAEERAMAANPELADPTAEHAATMVMAAVVPALALVSAVALGDGTTAAAGMLLGAGYSVHDIDFDEE